MSRYAVFAYGSNLNLPDLARWMGERGLGAPAVHEVRLGRLPEHTLAWRYRSPARGAGAADAAPAPGEVLPGAVLIVDASTFAALDQKEGHPHRYDRGPAPLGVELDDGEMAEAWVYRVTAPWRRRKPVPPSEAYLGLMVEGAQALGLDDAWVERLTSVEATGDPVRLREAAGPDLGRFDELGKREDVRLRVAEHSGEVVGISASRREGEDLMLLATRVVPAWRGQGVGQTLVEDAVHFAWTEGLARVTAAGRQRWLAALSFERDRAGGWSRRMPSRRGSA